MVIFLCFILVSRIRPGSDSAVRVDWEIQKYIRIKFLVSLFTGTLIGITLVILKVDLAFVFGLLTFLFNFIPHVGSVFATLMPIPLVLLDSSKSTAAKILALLLPWATHMIIGNFVEPNVFGRSLKLHPVMIVLNLAFWGLVLVVAGMILSVPIAVCMRIAATEYASTSELARMAKRLLEADFERVQSDIAFQHSPCPSPKMVSKKGSLELGIMEKEALEANEF